MLYKKILFVCLLFILSVNALFAKPPKVLVFSKTTFDYHESIPAGIAAIQLLGKQMHFDVDTWTIAPSILSKMDDIKSGNAPDTYKWLHKI